MSGLVIVDLCKLREHALPECCVRTADGGCARCLVHWDRRARSHRSLRVEVEVANHHHYIVLGVLSASGRVSSNGAAKEAHLGRREVFIVDIVVKETRLGGPVLNHNTKGPPRDEGRV